MLHITYYPINEIQKGNNGWRQEGQLRGLSEQMARDAGNGNEEFNLRGS